MAGHALPPSFVSRLRQRLQSCDQPLIQLWGWPWSGKRRLLVSLAAAEPNRWVMLPPNAPLRDRLSRPGPRWFVAEGLYRAADLLVAAEVLGPERRLILSVERRTDEEILPQRFITPLQMLLEAAEIEELFAGVSARVDELRRLSDGWLGPLSWLRDRGTPGESPESAFSSADFATRFHQRVTRRLDLGVFDLIVECSVAKQLDAALWRRVWIAQPEKLAALERLIGEWGWSISGPGEARRLPRLMGRAARARLPEERQREIYRRLGLAAHALGLGDEAERCLRLAKDEQRLGRLRSLGDEPAPGAGPPGVAGPGGAPRPARDPLPGFSLQLLGQPLIKRIAVENTAAKGSGRASGGPGPPATEPRELSWRLRRALLSVAYLALAPDRRATKDALVDAIWRDADPTSIAKNFHPTLSEARRTLGYRDVFVYRQGFYTLNPDLDWWIDCERFRERLADGRELRARRQRERQRALDLWLEAWRLYRGPLLDGIEAFWIRPRREALYHDYIELLRGIGSLCAELGRNTQALDAYRSLLLEEPFEERVHLAVMELYAEQGRRDLVRRQFVRMQELLLDELNVEPLEETQERYHQLMR